MQVPVQFDEKVIRTFEAFPPMGVPEHQELTFDFDHEEDGEIDDDDEAENVWLYVDLDPAALTMQYYDPVSSDLVLDGVPDSHAAHHPDWMLAASSHGSLFFWFEEITEMPEASANSEVAVYHEDDASLNDGTGEFSGAHGSVGTHLSPDYS